MLATEQRQRTMLAMTETLRSLGSRTFRTPRQLYVRKEGDRALPRDQIFYVDVTYCELSGEKFERLTVDSHEKFDRVDYKFPSNLGQMVEDDPDCRAWPPQCSAGHLSIYEILVGTLEFDGTIALDLGPEFEGKFAVNSGQVHEWCHRMGRTVGGLCLRCVKHDTGLQCGHTEDMIFWADERTKVELDFA